MDRKRKLTSALPAIAFVTLVTTGEIIALCQGKPAGYRVQTALKSDDLNKLYGVSALQAKIMLTEFIRLHSRVS